MFIILTRGSCLLGGCLYSLDSLIGVILMLVFPCMLGRLASD